MWRIYSIHGWMFALHRITGVALFAYLILHILSISTALLLGPERFNALMAQLARPGFLALDLVLLGCILFHALNGLRIILSERGWLPERSDAFSVSTVAATCGLWACAGLLAVLR